jgi:hypothetical protein
MSMTATARRIGDGLKHEVDVNAYTKSSTAPRDLEKRSELMLVERVYDSMTLAASEEPAVDGHGYPKGCESRELRPPGAARFPAPGRNLALQAEGGGFEPPRRGLPV